MTPILKVTIGLGVGIGILVSVLLIIPLLQPTETPTPQPTETPTPQPTPEGGVRVIELVSYQWGWAPETITVKQGEEVRLVITSTAEVNPDFDMHGFALPGYNIYRDLPVGETTVVEFVANEAGDFPFICSIYCGIGHVEMTGTLRVE